MLSSSPQHGRDGENVIERHYKTRELADLLGLHPETIRRAAQRGQLDSIRIGLDRIYAESAIQRWLEANRERVQLASVGGRRKTRASGDRREAR
jgi:excisionase family DNA binding protein